MSPPPATAAVPPGTEAQAELGWMAAGTYCVVATPTSAEKNSRLLSIHQVTPALGPQIPWRRSSPTSRERADNS